MTPTTPVTLAKHAGDLGAAQQPETGFGLGRGGHHFQKVPLRHQGDVLVLAGQVGEIQVQRLATNRQLQGVDEAMRNLGEPGSQTQFVQQPQRAGVHGVAPEITQEVGVLFHHRDSYATAGQEQAEHGCRPDRRPR